MAARTMLIHGAHKARVAARLLEDGLATGVGILIAIDSANVTAASNLIAQNGCTSTTQSANLLSPSDTRNPA